MAESIFLGRFKLYDFIVLLSRQVAHTTTNCEKKNECNPSFALFYSTVKNSLHYDLFLLICSLATKYINFLLVAAPNLKE